MDAKVGTKIMSEIQKEETIENLANKVKSHLSTFSDTLTHLFECNSTQDSSKVVLTDEKILFSLGSSIDKSLPSDVVAVPETAITQLYRSQMPYNFSGNFSFTEVSSGNLNNEGLVL